jgi:hypothetical protein
MQDLELKSQVTASAPDGATDPLGGALRSPAGVSSGFELGRGDLVGVTCAAAVSYTLMTMPTILRV